MVHRRRLGLAAETAGEIIVVDIFTLLLGLAAISVLVGAGSKILFRPPKVWGEADWFSFEAEESPDNEKPRKENPHLWMNNQ